MPFKIQEIDGQNQFVKDGKVQHLSDQGANMLIGWMMAAARTSPKIRKELEAFANFKCDVLTNEELFSPQSEDIGKGDKSYE